MQKEHKCKSVNLGDTLYVANGKYYLNELGSVNLSDVMCRVETTVPFLMTLWKRLWRSNDKEYLKALCSIFNIMHKQWTIMKTYKSSRMTMFNYSKPINCCITVEKGAECYLPRILTFSKKMINGQPLRRCPILGSQTPTMKTVPCPVKLSTSIFLQ